MLPVAQNHFFKQSGGIWLMESWNAGIVENWVIQGRNLILNDLHPSNPSLHISIIPLFQMGVAHYLIITGASRAKSLRSTTIMLVSFQEIFAKLRG